MKKVVIVGAGLAGLSAGYKLKQAGFDVHIFEARKRPGGRVASVLIGDSYEELGAKNILDGGEAKNILNLIAELGLETNEYKNDLSMYVDGIEGVSLFNNFFADHDFNQKIDELKSISPTFKNLEQIIEVCFSQSPEIASILSKMITTLEGLEPKLLSAKDVDSLIYLLDFFRNKSVSWCHVRGGNSKLPLSLAKNLEGCLHYNHVLSHAYKQDGNIRLVFNETKIVEADIVVFALPATVFADIDFSPEILPKKTLKKIQSLDYGLNSKILIPFNTMLGEYEFVMLPRVNCWFNFERSIMTAYSGGLDGINDFSSAQKVYKTIQSEFKLLSPYTQPLSAASDLLYQHYKGPVFKSWLQDPYAKGSYSNTNINSVKEYNLTVDILGESLIDIFKPLGNQVYFAGEHTSNQARGTMEGAVASGFIASKLINNSHA